MLRKVFFQNSEVIEHITTRNVALNTPKSSQTTFYSGDWETLPDALLSKTSSYSMFDYILTSETIYNPDCYTKLLKVFNLCLNAAGSV